MPDEPTKSITHLLHAAGGGDAQAADRLWATVYEELRGMARGHLAREGDACRMQTTSLVHEVYVRLVGTLPVTWENRRHFFGAAALAMRRILVDHARQQGRQKRRGDRDAVELVGEPPGPVNDPGDLLDLDEALKKLEIVDARRAEIVMLRYFAGLTVEEVAEVLNVSSRTINNEWRFARAWLHRELAGRATGNMPGETQ